MVRKKLKAYTIIETICAMLIICICFCCFAFYSVNLNADRIYHQHNLRGALLKMYINDLSSKTLVEENSNIVISRFQVKPDLFKKHYSVYNSISNDSIVYETFFKRPNE